MLDPSESSRSSEHSQYAILIATSVGFLFQYWLTPFLIGKHAWQVLTTTLTLKVKHKTHKLFEVANPLHPNTPFTCTPMGLIELTPSSWMPHPPWEAFVYISYAVGRDSSPLKKYRRKRGDDSGSMLYQPCINIIKSYLIIPQYSPWM